MNYNYIKISTKNKVLTITLNRPDRLNAWLQEMTDEIKVVMNNSIKSNEIRVIVITGEGRGFCAGADMDSLKNLNLEERKKNQSSNSPYDPFDKDWPVDFQRAQTWFPSVPKPIIAAINGPVAGIGLIMAMWCDIRFASSASFFSTAFSKRGLIAEHGLSWLLPRLVGMGHALDMTLSARRISAKEAERIGFVNKIFDENVFLKEVYDYAEYLANHVSPRSMKIMKRQLWQSLLQGLDVAVKIADDEMIKSFSTEDFKEGVAHFSEKRNANFTGK